MGAPLRVLYIGWRGWANGKKPTETNGNQRTRRPTFTECHVGASPRVGRAGLRYSVLGAPTHQTIAEIKKVYKQKKKCPKQRKVYKTKKPHNQLIESNKTAR